MTYKCQSCYRKISDERFNRVKYSLEFRGEDPPCRMCGGSFSKVGSKYEKKEENQGYKKNKNKIEEDFNYLTCSRCDRNYSEREKTIRKIADCNECDEEVYLCENCLNKICFKDERNKDVMPIINLNESEKEEIKKEITNKSRFD